MKLRHQCLIYPVNFAVVMWVKSASGIQLREEKEKSIVHEIGLPFKLKSLKSGSGKKAALRAARKSQFNTLRIWVVLQDVKDRRCY